MPPKKPQQTGYCRVPADLVLGEHNLQFRMFLYDVLDSTTFIGAIMTDLQYPIGKLERKMQLADSERKAMIQQIAETPANLRKAVAGLSGRQLDTPYRPEGWTVRQVVHHLPDSHMNAYVRVKLALTESQPSIKPYDEKRWSDLFDVKAAPIDVSLRLLEALHDRWVLLLRSLSPPDFARTMVHPESGVLTIDYIVNLYSWHGRHHVAHITSLRDRMGWK